MSTSGPLSLTIIPTYNELENLPVIIDRLKVAVPDMHVLIVDDGSPDGTGRLAEELAAADDHINVIHRTGKLGLGSAYVLGFGWALERGYDIVIEMDADGSHPPSALPSMIAAVVAERPGLGEVVSGASGPVGLAIGSRWVPGGTVVNWPMSRRLLSLGGNLYVRLAVGIGVRDATAGFRAYSAEVLRGIDLSSIDSLGYCFQVDLTLRTLDGGYRIVEVPIEFREREFGESKMSQRIVIEAMARVTRWGLRRRVAQAVGLVARRPRLASKA